MEPDQRAGGWTEAVLVALVARRLENHVGWRRWQVHADHGRVLLCDDFDDPVDQHVAALVARAVPGVVSVDTALRSCCPHHRGARMIEGPSALVGSPGVSEDGVPGST